MKSYLYRLGELTLVVFFGGAGEYVVAHGFEPTRAGIQGVVVAGLVAVYGVAVKRLGDKDRPTVG